MTNQDTPAPDRYGDHGPDTDHDAFPPIDYTDTRPSAPGITPGPWTFHPSARYRGDIGYAYDIATGVAVWDPTDAGEDGLRGEWQYPDEYVRLATTSDMGPEALANARAIAALPDMLAALALRAALEDSNAHDFDTRWKTLRTMERAALRKAGVQ